MPATWIEVPITPKGSSNTLACAHFDVVLCPLGNFLVDHCMLPLSLGQALVV